MRIGRSIIIVALCGALLTACGPARRDASAPIGAPSPAAASAVAPATVPPTAAGPPTAPPATAAATAPASPAPTQLPPGWTRIEPGGDTICARGTPFVFWARPARPDQLLIFFQGGGGCWDAETCRTGSRLFDDSVTDRDSPEHAAGIFDLSNPENPFKDYSMVYIPYCTGDVHMGDNVATYADAQGGQVIIHHKGFVNDSAALDWTYRTFSHPATVFVTGWSAGSIGSIVLAPYVISHYADARVVQLGDSEAFAFGRPADVESGWHGQASFARWIPAVAAIRPDQFSMAAFYSAIANYYPDRVFAQYNTAHDWNQKLYFEEAGRNSGTWEEALETSLREISASAPNFRSYVAGGTEHRIISFPYFYTVRVGDVRFRDWVDDLASGRPVPNVHCTSCDAFEYVR